MKIRRISVHTIFATLLVIFSSGWAYPASNRILAKCFATPPDSIQTSVYWYWVSGNIDKEGVVKDLEAMKLVGINRAFIGNIGLKPSQSPAGPVKLFNNEWWEILHLALKTAGELGIEIGIFNCPGWSQAGGPWIEPGQSMRYLASTARTVKGGGRITIDLKRPKGPFQDVRVLALPAARSVTVPAPIRNITSIEQIENLNKLILPGNNTDVFINAPNEVAVDLSLESGQTLRNLTLRLAPMPSKTECLLQVADNGTYKTIREFTIDRLQTKPEVGYAPFAPIVISLPDINTQTVRLVFSNNSPRFALRGIELSSHPKIERYPEKILAKMHPTPLPLWEEYQWPRQYPVNDSALLVFPDQVLDISDRLTGDQLVWDAPAGDWQIIRYGMLPTRTVNGPAAPEGTGLEVDKLTQAYLQHHFDSFLGAIMRRIPPEDRKTLKVMVADSYEVGGQNFTDTFLEDFKDHYGYDALPYLPVYNGIVVGSPDISDRFLWDVRRLVADKLAYTHIGGLRRIAHSHGLTLWLENYGHWGFPGEFLQYGGQSDEVAGEYWSEGSLGDIENRAASSCAHIYGKNKVCSESFTTAGKAYSRHPALMKQRGDRFFAEGVNSTLLHVWISQPEGVKLPGMNAWFGNEFNRNNTWFTHLDLFTDYLKRVNFMLQQGVNVADVCYFIGEDTPKMTGVTDPPLPPGYQFDYINAEVILRDMTVVDGRLTLPHGTSYRLMVLPKLETITPELLRKIRQLVEEGAAVLGPRPCRSPSLRNYPQADEHIQKIADDLWGAADGIKVRAVAYGKGLIMAGLTMEEALSYINCSADFVVSENVPVHFAHRVLADSHIYFITNQAEYETRFDATFRVSGQKPEWWDPVSGRRRELPVYTPTANNVTVPLKLEPGESAFIVFSGKASPAKENANTNFPAPQRLSRPDKAWTLTFQADRRGPRLPLTVEWLQDLSLSENDSIRYFSGTVVYENTFPIDKIPKNARVYLYTGEVGVMAKVAINGQYAGGIWTAPYRLDITDHIKPGTNDLRISVVNNWMNRLIGDLRLPEAQRGTWSPVNPWQADSPLQKSGLIGPITIEYKLY